MTSQRLFLVDLTPEAHAKLKEMSIRSGINMRRILSDFIMENMNLIGGNHDEKEEK